MSKPNTRGLCIRIHTGKCLSGTDKVKARRGLVCRKCHVEFMRIAREAALKQPVPMRYGSMGVRADADLDSAEKFLTAYMYGN